MAYPGYLVTPRDGGLSISLCSVSVFRQGEEMDFRKIVNAFRESDRFG